MAKEETNYLKEAEDDAKNMVEEFIGEIVEKLIEDGEASNDINNDYTHGDSYHHETHVDRSYSLLEAAELLDQLDQFEETDSGLWEGQEPRRAIETQAAFTYGNAVYSEWNDLIKRINDDAKEVLEEFAQEKDELENKKDELEAEEDGEDWTEEKAKELKSMGRKLEALDRRLKRALENSVYSSIGRKPSKPYGPREWSP